MKDHLSAKELTDVEMIWVKGTQLAEFSQDISTLKAGKELAAKCHHSDSKVQYQSDARYKSNAFIASDERFYC